MYYYIYKVLKMNKKTVFTIILIALVTFIANAQQSVKNPEPSVRTQGGDLIGIVMPETYVQRWIKDGSTLKAEAEKRGYRTEVLFSEADQSIQNNQIQSLLDKGAKALIIACINDGIAPAIAEARRKKVAVISYDRLIRNSMDYDYYITFSAFNVGVFQAQSIVDGLDLNKASASNPKSITLFAGSPTDRHSYFFFDGAMSVLNPYIDKGVLKVIGPYPRTSSDRNNFYKITTENWQASVARNRMEEILSNEARNITLDAILAPNDNLAHAILFACKRDSKYRNKLPITSGQDAEYESAESIKKGEQYSTVFKNTAELAEAAVIMADQILKGKPIDIPGAVLAEGDLAEVGNNGKKYVKTYLLDPTLITKDNLNIPVDAGFYDYRTDKGILLKN
jgi:putative multiple sugar transport system substrate-binding protein